MDTEEGESRCSGRRRLGVTCLSRSVLFVFAALTLLCIGCAHQKPMYIYRAYQEPQGTHGTYYLRDALVVAPNHATALSIIGKTLSQINPSWSGPIYISLVGVSDERREPGLMGGPLWLQATNGKNAEQRAAVTVSGE